MQISDETLMALADGELAADEAQAVQQAVDADPALQARLRRFSETRRLLQEAAGPAKATPADDPLIAMIRKAQTSAAEPTRIETPAPANLNRRPWQAIAAAVALAVVAVGWFGMDRKTGIAPAEIAALDSLPSGEAQGLEGGGDLTVIASYRDADGTLCREYETRGTPQVTVSLACRTQDGWENRFAATMTGDAEGFVPASGDIPGLDDALAGMGAPLSPEDEAAALKR